VVSRAGRRPGPTTTADAILAAAREAFARNGYQATTIRGIADAAGVSQALVRHFFGSKRDLFTAAVRFPADPVARIRATVQSAGREEVGRRITTEFVRSWRDPETGPQLQAFLRTATTTQEGAAAARGLVEGLVLPTLTERFDIPAEQAARGLAQLLGYALLASIIGAEPLAGLTEPAAVALLAPAVQAAFVPGDTTRPTRRG
jgi:AcrR family transcriptional regulator